MWQMWLIIAGIFFIAEIFTTGFLVFWFGIGGIVSMITSFFIPDLVIQTVIFIIVSVILIFATKPLVNRFLKTDSVNTNAFSIIGKHGIVIKDFDSIQGKGQIKVGHEVWSAEELNDKKLEKGAEVVVVKIDGVKAIVSAVKE
ncbi:MAG: NfeD family protein [Clostridia bacterium]|nr:NfeD family protein [Clostridia bacterium]